jgi:hypothetical protein
MYPVLHRPRSLASQSLPVLNTKQGQGLTGGSWAVAGIWGLRIVHCLRQWEGTVLGQGRDCFRLALWGGLWPGGLPQACLEDP